MIKGSHNSLTYWPALRWWRRRMHPFFRCQRHTIEEQWDAGARWFDIRVAYYKGRWYAAHGGTLLKGNVRQALRYLDERRGATVRIVLEREYESADRICFRSLCQMVRWEYPHIRFCGGVVKPGWEQVYDFETQIAEPMQWVGSMQPPLERRWWLRPWRYWGGALPCLWAAINNPKLAEMKIAPGTIVAQDFI